jgi:hypothetical protein
LREECDGPVVMCHIRDIMTHVCDVHGQGLKGTVIKWQPNGTKGWIFPTDLTVEPLPVPKCKYCQMSFGEFLGGSLDALVSHVKHGHPERVQGVPLPPYPQQSCWLDFPSAAPNLWDISKSEGKSDSV